jgi:hypothetical protein
MPVYAERKLKMQSGFVYLLETAKAGYNGVFRLVNDVYAGYQKQKDRDPRYNKYKRGGLEPSKIRVWAYVTQFSY